MQLTRVFAWTGILSIGGGRAAFFYEALVVRRRWLRTDEFVQDYTPLTAQLQRLVQLARA